MRYLIILTMLCALSCHAEDRRPVKPVQPALAAAELRFEDIDCGYIMAGSTFLGKISTDKYDGSQLTTHTAPTAASTRAPAF